MVPLGSGRSVYRFADRTGLRFRYLPVWVNQYETDPFWAVVSRSCINEKKFLALISLIMSLDSTCCLPHLPATRCSLPPSRTMHHRPETLIFFSSLFLHGLLLVILPPLPLLLPSSSSSSIVSLSPSSSSTASSSSSSSSSSSIASSSSFLFESFSPCARIGIIEGKTLSPSFLTSSPRDLPAT
ncbi:hypothetical protein C4D60_Mb01t23200 [Musa balbisiana]|uniref:Uncharacterized protein n=1 Tax=Musa balbisiana TaxID=52838 RepID=A0A4V4H7J8_MUSBA|nr:hypothetical protein C4D60_Mb01t23200 [Musa balbisiana]